jgi:hypothetical protein
MEYLHKNTTTSCPEETHKGNQLNKENEEEGKEEKEEEKKSRRKGRKRRRKRGRRRMKILSVANRLS